MTAEGFDIQAARKVAAERMQPFDTKYTARLRRELRDTLDAYEALLVRDQGLQAEIEFLDKVVAGLNGERDAAIRELGRFRILVERQPVS